MNIFNLTNVFTTITNGWVYFAKDVNGVQTDGRISSSNLLKPVTDAIVEIQEALEIVPRVIAEVNKISDFTVVLPINSYLPSGIVIKPISSTPTIKVGTTEGASDIYPETILTEAFLLLLQSYQNANQTLYFSVTGGTITIKYLLHEDF